LQDAIEGAAPLLILGEPGIGKTALADRLASQALERGALVLWSRCWDGPGAPRSGRGPRSSEPWPTEYGDEALRSFVRDGAAEIVHLAPDVAARLGEPADHTCAIDSDAGRFYVLRSSPDV
jgi:hypothetical protein